MDKPYAIFDMDGTLVDSMPYWKDLAREFLGRHGISPSPSLLEQIKTMTMSESAALFQKSFSLPGTPEHIAQAMNAMMEEHYRRDIPLKAGVKDYLDRLKKRGVTLCVASATAEPLMDACLTRLGVADHFAFLLSCEEVQAGKDRPDVYFAAAQQLGADPAQTAVYEDALYAAQTAKDAGFYVVGVYDPSARKSWDQLSALTDETIDNWERSLPL
ncbi:MAG: HAD family phosphatase [Evtepia sp.]|uniref:HAD family hydrolase n=1 Tax=Evtepia sp. TaxID=2773933 RepID=UPI002A7583E1|nr:HAD family phosphatase [Evtepia sp.]MDY3013939.1 HAD family phosphatase [Evtepia sp.]